MSELRAIEPAPSTPETRDEIVGVRGTNDGFPLLLEWKGPSTPPRMCSRCEHPRHEKAYLFCYLLSSDAVRALMTQSAPTTPLVCGSGRKRRADEDGDGDGGGEAAARPAKRLRTATGAVPLAGRRWHPSRLFNAVKRYAARLYKLGWRGLTVQVATVLFLFAVTKLPPPDQYAILSSLALATAHLAAAYIAAGGRL